REAAEPAAPARIDTAGEEKPPLPASKPAATDRAAPLIAALGPAVLRLAEPQNATMADLLHSDTAKGPDGHIARSWARIGAREAEERLQRLNADYAALADERDRLRERVRELEQTLFLAHAPQRPPQTARVPPDDSFG